MSDSQAYEEITVVSDGVTVVKRFEADEFPVPAIAFNFVSDRTEPVTVTLTDVVPEGVAVEDLGFHPEYGSEYWTIDDDTITFEREIEPGADYTTVYGIRATGTDNVEQFLTEPSIDMVDPPLEDDEGELVGEGADAVKDVISGDADSVPGLDEADDEEIETLDLNDPNGEGAPRREAQAEAEPEAQDAEQTEESEAPDHDDAGAANVELSGENLVAAMADELRNNEVSKEDVQILRKAFDLAGGDDGSMKARVDKLQSDVTEVVAYTDALEEFLDENGTGDEMIEEFQSEVEEFRTEVESFGAELEEVESRTGEHDEQIDTLASEVEGMDSEFDDVESQISDLESQLDDVQGELQEIRDQMGDTDVEAQIESIDEEIEELKQWREQLSSVIGGGE